MPLIISILAYWLESCFKLYMQTYEYKTQIGHLVLVSPSISGDNYHIFIDNDYQGNVVKLDGRWVGNLGQYSDLTIDEVAILGRIIEEKLATAV